MEVHMNPYVSIVVFLEVKMAKPLKALSIKQVSEKLGLSKSQIRRMVDKRQFPNPVQLSENRIGWLNTQIDEWLLSKTKGI
jgi:prophage regulatory protein